MSIQIEVVQSEKDEQAIVEFLLAREPLLAIPRWFSRSAFDPKPLGQIAAPMQLLFREADLDLVRDSLVPVPGDEGELTIPSSHGVGIEWTRTVHATSSEYSKGRFYLKYETPKSRDTTAALNRLFTAIVRYIKKNSPKKSAERYPFYVGRDLAEMVNRGEALVVWPGGKVVELVDNIG